MRSDMNIINIIYNYHLQQAQLSKDKRSTLHIIGNYGDDIFTGLMTQPTVSKH